MGEIIRRYNVTLTGVDHLSREEKIQLLDTTVDELRERDDIGVTFETIEELPQDEP